MSKISKACDISPTTRQMVYDRDGRRCIICGTSINIQVAHYISRGRLGLGIPENLVCMCDCCHREFDNGFHHNEIKKAVESYLRQHYDNWDNINKIYTKWR